MEKIEVGFRRRGQAEACPTGVLIRANQHFLRAATARNQPHSRFHQAEVCFRGRLDFRRVQAHFASAAERHPLRRRHHRLWRVFDRQVDVLELLDRHVQFVPLLLLRSH